MRLLRSVKLDEEVNGLGLVRDFVLQASTRGSVEVLSIGFALCLLDVRQRAEVTVVGLDLS